MSEVHADDIMAVIRERGWWHGCWWQSTDIDRSPGERVCLAMALAAVVPVRLRDIPGHNPEWVRWDVAVRAAAKDLFPDRTTPEGAGWSQVDFNDHPDTTLADVELVVKEAEARL